jgi:hypothetical protein
MSATMAKKKPEKDRHLPFRTVRLPLELYRQIAEVAEANDRPVSREIKRALEAHIRAHRQRPAGG